MIGDSTPWCRRAAVAAMGVLALVAPKAARGDYSIVSEQAAVCCIPSDTSLRVGIQFEQVEGNLHLSISFPFEFRVFDTLTWSLVEVSNIAYDHTGSRFYDVAYSGSPGEYIGYDYEVAGGGQSAIQFGSRILRKTSGTFEDLQFFDMEASGIELLVDTQEIIVMGLRPSGVFEYMSSSLEDLPTLFSPDYTELQGLPIRGEQPGNLIEAGSLAYDRSRDWLWACVLLVGGGQELWAWNREGEVQRQIVLGSDIEGNLFGMTHQSTNLFWIVTSESFYQLALDVPASITPEGWSLYE